MLLCRLVYITYVRYTYIMCCAAVALQKKTRGAISMSLSRPHSQNPHMNVQKQPIYTGKSVIYAHTLVCFINILNTLFAVLLCGTERWNPTPTNSLKI